MTIVPSGAMTCSARKRALVEADLRADRHEEREKRGRRRVGQGAVDVPGHLRIAAGVIEGDALVFDLEGHTHLDHPVLVDAVVIDQALGGVGAVRDAANRRTHLLFGYVEDPLHRRVERLAAILVEQRLEAALADLHRADLALQVALDEERQEDVEQDGVPQALVRLALDVELRRRDPDALLPDALRARVVAGDAAAADVGVMAFRDGPEGDLLARRRPASRS